MSCSCEVCGSADPKMIDGICSMCEPTWLDFVESLSVELPKDTPIEKLFYLATKKTKESRAAPPPPPPSN